MGWSRLCGGKQLPETYNATPSYRLAHKRLDQRRCRRANSICQGDFSHGISAPVSLFGTSSGIVGPRLGLRFYRRRYLTPTPTTTIGYWLPFRHQPKDRRFARNIRGRIVQLTPRLILPDIVSVGLRQRLTPQWTVWPRSSGRTGAGSALPAWSGARRCRPLCHSSTRMDGCSRSAPNIMWNPADAARRRRLREVADHRRCAHPAVAGQRPLSGCRLAAPISGRRRYRSISPIRMCS